MKPQCAISLEVFLKSDVVQATIKCGHSFHDHCIQQRLQRSWKVCPCPQCRRKYFPRRPDSDLFQSCCSTRSPCSCRQKVEDLTQKLEEAESTQLNEGVLLLKSPDLFGQRTSEQSGIPRTK